MMTQNPPLSCFGAGFFALGGDFTGDLTEDFFATPPLGAMAFSFGVVARAETRAETRASRGNSCPCPRNSSTGRCCSGPSRSSSSARGPGRRRGPASPCTRSSSRDGACGGFSPESAFCLSPSLEDEETAAFLFFLLSRNSRGVRGRRDTDFPDGRDPALALHPHGIREAFCRAAGGGTLP